MGTYLEEKRAYDDAYHEGLNKTGIFFAFDRKQFDEQKHPKNASDKNYISLGYGAYIHKRDLDKYNHFMAVEAPSLRKKFLDAVSMDDLIRDELGNHECGYTGDISEVVEIVMDYYSLSEKEATSKVQRVFKEKRS